MGPVFFVSAPRSSPLPHCPGRKSPSPSPLPDAPIAKLTSCVSSGGRHGSSFLATSVSAESGRENHSNQTDRRADRPVEAERVLNCLGTSSRANDGTYSIMSIEVLKELVEAGVHFGHQSKKWNPKMKPYLLDKKNNIHIINLEETVRQIDEASVFLGKLARDGKKILFVGCKRQAQDAVREAAEATKQYYVNNRWLGGTLTNLETVRKSVKRLDYLENIEKHPDFKKMSKSELAALGRERSKLQRNLLGIRGLDRKPDAMVIVDTAREVIAVAEAQRLGVPIVGFVDSNADPDKVDFPIAANDDAIRSIRIILQKLVDAILSAK